MSKRSASPTVGELVQFLMRQDQSAKVALRHTNHLHVGVLDFFNPKPVSGHRTPIQQWEIDRHNKHMADYARYRVEPYACPHTGRIWFAIFVTATGEPAVYRYPNSHREAVQNMFLSHEEAAGKIARLIDQDDIQARKNT